LEGIRPPRFPACRPGMAAKPPCLAYTGKLRRMFLQSADSLGKIEVKL
jgi:hypothetical protein